MSDNATQQVSMQEYMALMSEYNQLANFYCRSKTKHFLPDATTTTPFSSVNTAPHNNENNSSFNNIAAKLKEEAKALDAKEADLIEREMALKEAKRNLAAETADIVKRKIRLKVAEDRFAAKTAKFGMNA